MKWLTRLTESRAVRMLSLAAGLAVVVLLLMLWLLGAFHRKVAPQPGLTVAAPPMPASQPVAVKYVEIPLQEAVPGTIRPVLESYVASKVMERVIEVNVIAGQEVKKGQVLVRLDRKLLETRLEQAKAALAAAKASRDDAKLNLDRMQQAFGRGVATQTELDGAKARFEVADAEQTRAQQALDEAQTNLNYTEIRSPIDGVIIDKRVNVGDTVAPGQVLLTMYDKMQLIANVRESLMRHLKVGQSIGVYLEDLGRTCQGAISEIVPQADPATRTFPVKVTGPCQAGVKPGMYAKLIVPLGTEKVLVIPPAAVQKVGQLTMVQVIEGNSVHRRAVRLGRTLNVDGVEYVEVLSGLNDTEKVALLSERAGGNG
ncbi:MAG: efflux RND transporter periplasmic adaptor subunit [Phycisphaerae bacterium]